MLRETEVSRSTLSTVWTGGKSLPFFISHAHFLLKQEMVGHQKIMK